MRARCSDGMPEPGVGDLRDRPIAVDAGRDRQPAAARHGVARVQEQVEEHLLELVLDAEHDHGGPATARGGP